MGGERDTERIIHVPTPHNEYKHYVLETWKRKNKKDRSRGSQEQMETAWWHMPPIIPAMRSRRKRQAQSEHLSDTFIQNYKIK